MHAPQKRSPSKHRRWTQTTKNRKALGVCALRFRGLRQRPGQTTPTPTPIFTCTQNSLTQVITVEAKEHEVRKQRNVLPYAGNVAREFVAGEIQTPVGRLGGRLGMSKPCSSFPRNSPTSDAESFLVNTPALPIEKVHVDSRSRTSSGSGTGNSNHRASQSDCFAPVQTPPGKSFLSTGMAATNPRDDLIPSGALDIVGVEY